ncbi:MAG: hypothetical protein AB7V50_00625 [Vampirovibrionia bacterium]
MALDFGITIIAFLIVANMTFIVIVACGVYLTHATLRVVAADLKKLIDILDKKSLVDSAKE